MTLVGVMAKTCESIGRGLTSVVWCLIDGLLRVMCSGETSQARRMRTVYTTASCGEMQVTSRLCTHVSPPHPYIVPRITALDITGLRDANGLMSLVRRILASRPQTERPLTYQVTGCSPSKGFPAAHVSRLLLACRLERVRLVKRLPPRSNRTLRRRDWAMWG